MKISRFYLSFSPWVMYSPRTSRTSNHALTSIDYLRVRHRDSVNNESHYKSQSSVKVSSPSSG